MCKFPCIRQEQPPSRHYRPCGHIPLRIILPPCVNRKGLHAGASLCLVRVPDRSLRAMFSPLRDSVSNCIFLEHYLTECCALMHVLSLAKDPVNPGGAAGSGFHLPAIVSRVLPSFALAQGAVFLGHADPLIKRPATPEDRWLVSRGWQSDPALRFAAITGNLRISSGIAKFFYAGESKG